MNTTNPCFCSGTTPIASPKLCATGNCICFCDVYISPNSDLAVPCLTQGVVNLNEFDRNLDVCSNNSVSYQVMYYEDDFFLSASITRLGVLTWTPKNQLGRFSGNLVFKISCGALSKLVTVTIAKKDMCSGVVCPQGYTCDQCTGDCHPVDGVANIAVQIQKAQLDIRDSGNITVNIK